jgi:hypothetical protein
VQVLLQDIDRLVSPLFLQLFSSDYWSLSIISLLALSELQKYYSTIQL